jgi:lipopolysaccharide transport system ATP-binding protein
VRLAFAVAAHLDPDILLIDEVLAVGDAAFQKKCLGKTAELLGKNRTILFVSHTSEAVARTCERVLYMEHGRLIADGPTADVMAKYLAGERDTPHTAQWKEQDAPGSDIVRLMSAAVEQDGTGSNIFNVEKDVRLFLKFNVLKTGHSFKCGVSFSTQGVCAFSSIEPMETVKHKTGEHMAILTIPANLLAEGSYVVSVNILSHKGGEIKHVSEADVITFEVFDPHTGHSAKGETAMRLAGVLMPKLHWENH